MLFVNSIIILALKYILQLKLFVEIFGYDPPTEGNDEISSKYETIITNLEYYKIGFKYLKTTYGAEFFNYIVFDALIIIFLFDYYFSFLNLMTFFGK